MGMYTDLKVKVKLKDEFIPVIQTLITKDVNDHDSRWHGLGYDFLDEYSKYSRADFIPFGWTYDNKNTLTDGVWYFTCSLKNYDRTIEYFLENVLAKMITDSYEIEYCYEEWWSSRYYDFIDGRFVISVKETHTYESDGFGY